MQQLWIMGISGKILLFVNTKGNFSAFPARLGLEAPALAWPEGALASSNFRPGQSRQLGLGSGLAWLGPRLYV